MNLRANSLSVSIGGIIRLAVNLAAIPLLVRLLGIEAYGTWTTINAQVGLLTLAEFGLSAALLYRLAGYLAQKESKSFYRCTGTALTLATLFGSVFSLAYFLLIPLIARTFQTLSNDAALLTALKISALLILPRIWTLFFTSLEASHQRYDLQTIIETATTVLLQTGIVVLAWVKAGFPALVGWALLSSLIGLIAHAIVSNRMLRVDFGKLVFSKTEAIGLMQYGSQQWISSLGSSLFGSMDRILVNATLGAGAAGIYSAATSITAKINELSAIPIKVITPAISAEKAKGNLAAIQRIYLKATKLNGFAVLLVALPLIFWSDLLARIIVDSGSALAFSTLLPLLAGIYGIYSLGASGFYLMLGMGKPKVNALWGIIGGLTLCVALPTLATRFGLTGAAWANAAYILVIAINFHGSQLLGMRLGEYGRIFLRSVIILALWAGGALLLPINDLALWLRIVLFFTAGLASIIFAIGKVETIALIAQAREKLLHRNSTQQNSTGTGEE